MKSSLKPKSGPQTSSRDSLIWLWGTHSVCAALQNPHRKCHHLLGTTDTLKACTPYLAGHPKLKVTPTTRHELDALLPLGTLHQGLALQVSPLPLLFLNDFLKENPQAKRVVVLDQLTDPHNVGAILRSACAFGIDGVLLTLRHSPPLEGVLAKSASGALDKIPLVWTTNLAQGLALLKAENFWCIGLTERGTPSFEQVATLERLALILGAEGRGLRPLTMDRCDFLVSLPTHPEFPTLNVSSAAAITFYAVQK